MKKHDRIKKAALFLGMFAGIALAGFIIGGFFALIGSVMMKGKFLGLGGMVGGLGGLVIGYPIGIICGIILFCKWLKYNGAILYGTLGCLLGAVIIMVLAVPLKLDIPILWTLSLYFVLTPLIGTIGFYLGRKTERKQKHRKGK